MGAAIWSAGTATLRSFPGDVFRALLPQPRNAVGRRPAAVAHDARRFRALRREAHGAVSATASGCARRWSPCGALPRASVVKAAGCESERFDRVFFACHSDQALRLLADATNDANVRCSAPSATSATTCCCTRTPACCRAAGWPGPRGTTTCWIRATERVAVTYNMNILQRLESADAAAGDAQPDGSHRSGARHQARSPTSIRCSRPRRWPHSRGRPRSTAPIARISAAPTGALAFTRMAW